MFSRTNCGDVIEMAGFHGIDFVVIDTEHGPPDGVDVRDLIRAAECAGVTPIVRPYDNNQSLIIRALDVGAVGIMIPHVKNREDAERAVRAVKYSPRENVRNARSCAQRSSAAIGKNTVGLQMRRPR